MPGDPMSCDLGQTLPRRTGRAVARAGTDQTHFARRFDAIRITDTTRRVGQQSYWLNDSYTLTFSLTNWKKDR